MDYKKAGVDIEAGYKSVELMKEHVKRTMREEVLGGLGGFSGAFFAEKDQRDGRSGTAVRNRRMRNQSKTGDDHGQTRYHWNRCCSHVCE